MRQNQDHCSPDFTCAFPSCDSNCCEAKEPWSLCCYRCVLCCTRHVSRHKYQPQSRTTSVPKPKQFYVLSLKEFGRKGHIEHLSNFLKSLCFCFVLGFHRYVTRTSVVLYSRTCNCTAKAQNTICILFTLFSPIQRTNYSFSTQEKYSWIQTA